MTKPRVGVIGVGHLGKQHARIYHQLGALAAVVDSDEKRAAEIAGPYSVPHYSDYRQLFGRVDAVSVAVPTIGHHVVAKEFLERGIAALVEKPLTKTIEQGEELCRIAREKKVVLQVGHVERFNPAVTAVLDVIRKPRFIEIHRLSPFRFRSSDIDVVLDLMIHDLDIVLHLTRSPLVRVDAVGMSLLFGKEDMANARLEFEDGCVANLTASRISEKSMRKTRIFSEDCYVTVDTLAKEAWIYRTTPQLGEALAKLPKDRDLNLADLATIPKEFYSIQEVKLAEEEPLARELQSFLDAVEHKRDPVVPGEHGVRAMKAADTILTEMRAHRWK
ncbi:MAG TPA: Gfo/Idh/MocA family oxidoreductase [Planctomycetota bacterium]|nr:Gfo/Idh/MocA family oxidoreductase [Planctomycetota bacterium]